MVSSELFGFAPSASAMRHQHRPGGASGCSAAPRWVAWIVGVLLIGYAVMAWTASLDKGVSFDEGQQLAVGYNLWLRGDYRIEGANGDLVKRWATLPYLITHPRFVEKDNVNWLHAEPYKVARSFFFRLGNPPEWLLAQGRAMMALMGIALGWLVFRCGSERFGWRGGLVSLVVYTFSPHMLAFGGIVSTDLSITLTLLASTGCIWRLLHEVTLARVLGSLACFGLLLLAKMTALVIFPIALVLVGVRLLARQPWEVRWRDRRWRLASGRTQMTMLLALVLLHAVAGWGAIWAHYGFRYAASPDPSNPKLVLRIQPDRDPVPGTLAKIVNWSRDAHFLPEGYCKGIDWLLGNDDLLPAFMNGRYKHGGWWNFFPYTIWVKTEPAVLVLLALSAVTVWRLHRAGSGGATILYAATPHFVLIGVYLAVAMTEDINLGHRHVLPIYPSLYVLGSGLALGWMRKIRWASLALIGLLAWSVTDSLMARPFYLAYFGAQAGGADEGYKHLIDSSLDWGMNLPRLKEWLDENNPGNRKPVFLAYFGTDSPKYYGIKAQRLPGFFDWNPREPYPFKAGYYAISATLFQGQYLAASGPWNRVYEKIYKLLRRDMDVIERSQHDPAVTAEALKLKSREAWLESLKAYEHFRFARLCAWLRHHGEPQYQIGHSLFIWKLGYDDLKDALLGPPPEMEEPADFVREQYREPQ